MLAALPTGVRGQVLALALTVLAAGAAWLAVAAPLLAWHTDRAERLVQRQTLADRMASVAATLPQLRRQAEGLPASAAPQPLLQGASDAVAGAALQGQLDRMASEAGIALSSAELLPAEAAGSYRRIAIRLTANGPWPALVALLQAVAQASPRMLVDDLQLQAAPSVTSTAAPPVSVTLTVLAFRAGPGPQR